MSNDPKEESRSQCPIANVLDIAGDRWTLLIVRDLLLFNKHEYKEFLASPESIATNILADRLRRLTCVGIVSEIAHPTNKSRKLYYLMPSGKALLPLLMEMAIWGASYLTSTEIPKHVVKKIKMDPEVFKKQVLDTIEQWEKKHLPKSLRKTGGRHKTRS